VGLVGADAAVVRVVVGQVLLAEVELYQEIASAGLPVVVELLQLLLDGYPG
jgi:hypothetical protein